jgi:DegV family protein with EDD domain
VIRIVTDTSADLPDDLAAQHGITQVPLTVRFGDEEFVDREDLSPGQFWDKLLSSDELPQTAAPSAGRFQQAFLELAAGGADGIVAVCISSALSATFQAAEVAAKQVADQVPVQVIDSRLVSGTLGLVALEAARAAAGGDAIDAVAATAVATAAKSNVLGALDTLEYLRRGGRIGAAQAFFGGLLNVKPLISLQDGVVAPAGRVRTRRKAMAAVLAKAEELGEEAAEVVAIHGAADHLDDFLSQLGERIPAERTIVAELGCVVGTHTGPGLIGLCYRLR